MMYALRGLDVIKRCSLRHLSILYASLRLCTEISNASNSPKSLCHDLPPLMHHDCNHPIGIINALAPPCISAAPLTYHSQINGPKTTPLSQNVPSPETECRKKACVLHLPGGG